mmetsp:Transcript_1497/g.4278  ORF Transcript_1497/g.4278 Transcript_1497/m.4278 type:complete len:215 (+) Transcript_1497:2-646(+)
MSVRLWLDRRVATRSPANVFARFEQLRGAGGTFFMLDQTQREAEAELWGGEAPQGSVVACDFYNSGALMGLSDEAIVETLIAELLPAAVPDFANARVVDHWVGRYASAVSWFSPGSYARRPPLATRVPNLACAGDWVRMGAREHGAKGLCQERAYVSGIQAANHLKLGPKSGPRGDTHVRPVREDETQVLLGREANKKVMGLLAKLGMDSPWVR